MTDTNENTWLDDIFDGLFSGLGDNPLEEDEAKQLILDHEAKAVERARIEELTNIQRELNKNEIAGAVKWYVEDCLKQLQSDQEKSA